MTLDRPYSILVTDDDPASRETFREIFEPALRADYALLAGYGYVDGASGPIRRVRIRSRRCSAKSSSTPTNFSSSSSPTSPSS